MTKLVIQHRAIEARIKALQGDLSALEQQPGYADEVAFVGKLDNLMREYSKGIRDIIAVLDPDAAPEPPARSARGPAPGYARPRLTYRNPNTQEIVTTASGNNAVLKDWRKKYPDANIKDWIVEED